jgi:hypothetical protein
LPLFVSLLVLAFVFSITFVIGSLGLADTCIDDPDARFLSVADHYLDGISPIIFEFVELYLSRKLQHMQSIAAGNPALRLGLICPKYTN